MENACARDFFDKVVGQKTNHPSHFDRTDN